MALKMQGCFQDSLEHLVAELKRVELMLRLRAEKLRLAGSDNENAPWRGLCVSEDSVNQILGKSPLDRDSGNENDNPGLIAAIESLHRLELELSEKKTESRHAGLVLPLDELAERFCLSPDEVDVLLVCLLPELNLDYQQVFAFLQNDATRRHPDVNLLLHLLCESFEDRIKLREIFSPEATLIKYHLIRLFDDNPTRPAPLLAKLAQIDERLVCYLLGNDRIDVHLLQSAYLVQPELKLRDLVIPAEFRGRLVSLIEKFKDGAVTCYLQGTEGAGGQALVEASCFELEVPLLNIDVGKLLMADIPFEQAIGLIFREGRLQKTAIYFKNFDLLLKGDKENTAKYDILLNEVNCYPHWVFLEGERSFQPGGTLSNNPFVNIDLPIPSYEVRKQLWEKQRESIADLPAGIDLAELASKFRLNSGQIRDVVATARNIAVWRDPENVIVTPEDIYSACRVQFRDTLNTLSRKIIPRYSWGDIILPKDQMEQLREICSYMKHYQTVYGDWGFGRRISLGLGLNVLFAGPSGTGKTMAAEILAGELGLDLYKIDLSSIVSKYIGETEKNLDRVFREGQISNAILFFDEADALFGKRSEVRDSHDRYANVEVAYLLQRMEEYDGAVILATNLRKNMDDAFARRMHFALEFPMPEEPDRYRIWKNVFPPEAPIAADANLAFMARQFKITGGNIKNIALGAAFLAAENGGHITMGNLVRATKREYQKTGKLCTEADFAEYFELIKS
jgi:AAA+ superfamily predicted ATPase